MLVSWGRVFVRGVGLKPFLQCKPVTVSGGQFLPVRALATAATKKVASRPRAAATRSKISAKKPSTTRTKLGATRKVAAKSVTRAGAKKTAAKKVAAKKVAAKKTATKKVAAKKSAAKKNPGVKTRTARKPMSEEEKNKAKLRARVKALIVQALRPPISINSTNSPWVAFLSQKLQFDGVNAGSFLKEQGGKLVEEYKGLTPAQHEVRSPNNGRYAQRN